MGRRTSSRACREGVAQLSLCLALPLALSSAACSHRTVRPDVASAARLHSAEPEAGPPVGSGDGVAPRAATPERARSGPEDTSKKSASLETAAYTDSDHVTVVTPAITGNIENVVD